MTRTTQKRTFVDGWVNGKSDVHKLQLKFQDPSKAHLHGADNPTYLKQASDKIPAAIGGVLFGWSLLSAGSGMWNMGKSLLLFCSLLSPFPLFFSLYEQATASFFLFDYRIKAPVRSHIYLYIYFCFHFNIIYYTCTIIIL